MRRHSSYVSSPRQLVADRPRPSADEMSRMAEVLDADGFPGAAQQYRGKVVNARALEEAISKTADHLRDLGREVRDTAALYPKPEIVDGVGVEDSDEPGSALADWLITQGWQPPSKGFAWHRDTGAEQPS